METRLVNPYQVCMDCEEKQIEILGNDVGQPMAVGSYELCLKECQKDSQCVHVTFYQGLGNQCYKKSADSPKAITTIGEQQR